MILTLYLPSLHRRGQPQRRTPGPDDAQLFDAGVKLSDRTLKGQSQ
jgi:hypothetical protein